MLYGNIAMMAMVVFSILMAGAALRYEADLVQQEQQQHRQR
jgi:hypothetical protein